jgi:hypothetical protein
VTCEEKVSQLVFYMKRFRLYEDTDAETCGGTLREVEGGSVCERCGSTRGAA